ncbi:threonine/serine exporter family protein [Sporosalibacterium faouarense]|uniref:threonine/serine exporter family protein n=1 Tax=Sporosalibacterium faouarense TaxID=516123 RepID=UPI00141D6509|nr:threonine/serine exporter family protein [Sporosalibacterium faouarense]MTI47770.1 threonine/serine exporter [Bacillota bacterium]
MFMVKQFLLALVSTIGFCILFNVPRDSIFKAGIIGSIGWIVYISISDIFDSTVGGAFVGALTIGILGEIFARLFKKPATIFIIPGIIPLVPGAGSYYTMLAIIEKRYTDAANFGSETIFIALSISSGIIIASTISKSFRRRKAA